MKDPKLSKLVEQVREELHDRYGKKMCKELHFDCPDCSVRILISLLNKQLDLLEHIGSSVAKIKTSKI